MANSVVCVTFDVATDMIKYAFDHGVTHFDLANNYGPVPGSAETNFGRILRELQGYRDEMIISFQKPVMKWAGPLAAEIAPRKNLMASMTKVPAPDRIEYFDIFYSHRYDGVTRVEETIQTLIDIVKQGKALLSESPNPPEQARMALRVMMAKAEVSLPQPVSG